LEPVSIVGHGQSPLDRGWGPRIDETIVIRLKDPSWQNKEDYGTRVDCMCASTETLPVMLDYKKVPKRYFGQPKKGSWNPTVEASFRSRAQAPLVIPIDLFLTWNAIFKTLGREEVRNFSLGMFAILCACEFLKAEEIMLVGFDNLLGPDRPEYHKANKGKWVTHHDWKAENRMLPIVEEKYGVTIVGFR